MTIVTLELPEEGFSARRLPPEEFVQDMRQDAAIYWYQKVAFPKKKPPQIAGLNRRDFLVILAREQIDVFQVDFNDIQSELERG